MWQFHGEPIQEGKTKKLIEERIILNNPLIQEMRETQYRMGKTNTK